jgi:hypothetical protein
MALIVIGFHLFWITVFLIHMVSTTSLWPSRDLHLLHRDLGISMDSLVAIKLKGPVLPPILDPEALLGQGLFKSLGLGSLSIIASREYLYASTSGYHFIIKIVRD